MTATERLHKRNKDVRKTWEEMEKKFPQWRSSAIETAVADKFYISERTVRAIMSETGIYSDNYSKN